MQIRWTARSNRPSQTADGARLLINGATTGYSQHNLRADGSSFAAYGGNANEIGWTLLPASNYGADPYASGYMDILDAFETNKYTTTRGFWFVGTNPSYRFFSLHSASLRSLAAVDTLAFSADTGSLVAGTRLSLYGLKASA